MPATTLIDRALIRLSGDDVRAFLQGLVTNDVALLAPDRPLWAGLLTAQGKALFDFILWADGEDVLQDALIKAVETFASAGPIGNPEAWLFKIAHNTALDFLRRRNRQQALRSGEDVDMIADDADMVASREIARGSIPTIRAASRFCATPRIALPAWVRTHVC